MSTPDSEAKRLLHEDLSKEYFALLSVVSSYDGWLLIVKGWSVTLALAGLGVGFQQQHYALFGLAALTSAAFWMADGLMKGYQYRYYVRMREIEYSLFLINRVALGGEYGGNEISAPRIDMTWGYKGEGQTDWRADPPERRSPAKISRDLRTRFLWANVALPHVVAVVVGGALFLAALLDSPGLGMPL